MKQSASTPRGAGRRMLRWGINLAVVLHFTGVLAAAGSVLASPGYVTAIWDVFRPYLQCFSLNQGYNFFAPEPVPAHILEFEITRGDGTTVRRQLPDLSKKPHLLYERHLLLAEHIGISPLNDHRDYYRSYARHLCEMYGASKVRVIHFLHYPLTMEMVRNGVRLDDPVSFEEIDRGEFACGEL
jgi:hypothetical protein